MSKNTEILEQIAQLEAMRTVLGEETYRQARARLEAALDLPVEKPEPEPDLEKVI